MNVNTERILERLPAILGVRRDPRTMSSLVMLPLRLFFGATFVYAGLQKLTDTQFFSPTAAGFIGHQMSGFVRAGSPLSGMINTIALPHAKEFGALIAFCEVWIGLSALFGLLTRFGALGGLATSLTFYLTATWSTHPYFLGADLPYAFGWLTLALAGPDAWSLDNYFFNQARLQAAESTRAQERVRGKSRVAAPPTPSMFPRKAALRGLGTAAGLVVGGGIVGAIARALTPNGSQAGASTAMPTATGSGAAAGSGAQAGQTLLGSVKSLAVNSAAAYTDPGSGDPALLIHLPDGTFVAYDAVCTHAGCTVQYDPTQHQMVCPCHGAAFDPTHAAAVINGPAQQPLTTLNVKVDAQGNAYAV
jgi:thiosulfate dehydrogenase [quinone] large subunit